MALHSDFDQNVVITPSDAPSPRLQLDQLDGDTAWETYFIQAAPGETITAGDTSTGEEYLILSGELKNGEENYASRSFLRFPSEAQRTLTAGPEGTYVFVKKQHLAPTDRQLINIPTNQQEWHQGRVPGLSVMPLHSHEHESMALVKWAPNTQFLPHVHPGGEEIIVLEGTFHDEHGSYPTGTWIRNKPYSQHTPHTKEDGCLIYVKTGHLPPLN